MLEQFCQRIFFNRRSFPQDDINKIKTKMRITCEKYSCANVPYKYREIVSYQETKVLVMKQDKRGGIVIMNRGKYFDRCLTMLKTDKSKSVKAIFIYGSESSYCSLSENHMLYSGLSHRS